MNKPPSTITPADVAAWRRNPSRVPAEHLATVARYVPGGIPEPDVRDLIRESDRNQRAADAQLHADVARARVDGLTWEQIAQVLGVSRQAVQQRFGGPPRRR